MTIKISLTQFITFKSKVSTSAKIKYLKEKVKYVDYTPFADYWLPLRSRIKGFADGRYTENQLIEFVNNVDPNKRANYKRDLNKLPHFVNENKVSFFDVQKSYWNYNDQLRISASPELGVVTNSGEKYLLKNSYTIKKDDEKLLKRNILPTLTLMNIANDNPNISDATPAVLNLRNGKLIKSNSNLVDTVELEVDAQQIIDIWNKI